MIPFNLDSSIDLINYVNSGLRRAAGDAQHPWRLPVLITSNEGRIVVLRGVDSENGTWRFFTDRRTPKVQQIAVNAREAAATFYHPKERAQVRLSGKVILVEEAVHKQYWDKLSVGQKSSYGAVSAPGSELASPGNGLSESWSTDKPTTEEENEAFKNFAVFTFNIEEVELLLLLREGHRRCCWEGWGGNNFKWLIP